MGLHIIVPISLFMHGASIMVLGLLKKKRTEEEEKKALVLTLKQPFGYLAL